MTGDQHNDLARALGEIEGRLKGIETACEQFWRNRMEIHGKLTEVEKKIDTKLAKISSVEKDLERMQRQVCTQIAPLTEDYSRMKARGLAFLVGFGVAAGGVGATVQKYLAKIW
jgi:chromosome segregation ATPase